VKSKSEGVGATLAIEVVKGQARRGALGGHSREGGVLLVEAEGSVGKIKGDHRKRELFYSSRGRTFIKKVTIPCAEES